MKNNTPRLVQTGTADNLLLDGFYVPAESKTVLLYVHGFASNFYKYSFIRLLAEKVGGNKIAMLAGNNRGAETDTMFFTTSGDFRHYGARFELIEDSYYDIDAWISFLISQGYTDIILAGHSLGTMKVVRYLFEGKHRDNVSKLILLAPFDRLGLLKVRTQYDVGELLHLCEEKINSGQGDELTDEERFGSYRVSYKTVKSVHTPNEFNRIFEFCNEEYVSPILKKIKIPTLAIAGSQDNIVNPTDPDNVAGALARLSQSIPQIKTVLIQYANHSFWGHEQKLIEEILAFCR